MAIEFRCSQCNKLLRTGEATAGKQARCPECGAISQVPAAGAAPPGEAAPSFPPPEPPPSEGPGSPFAPGGRPAGGADAGGPYQPPLQYGPPPGQPYGAAVPRYVPNYLVQAILCTLFCCLPFGIVAIVFAAQVNGKLAAGDYHGAVSCSDSARMWCWVSFWLGIVPVILWFLFAIMMGIGAGIG